MTRRGRRIAVVAASDTVNQAPAVSVIAPPAATLQTAAAHRCVPQLPASHPQLG